MRKAIILTIFVTLVNHFSMHSQIGIMNLSINPKNPTPTTQIKAVAYSFFSSSGCIFINSTVTVSNDTIRVVANHQVGPFMALC